MIDRFKGQQQECHYMQFRSWCNSSTKFLCRFMPLSIEGGACITRQRTTGLGIVWKPARGVYFGWFSIFLIIYGNPITQKPYRGWHSVDRSMQLAAWGTTGLGIEWKPVDGIV